VSSPSCPLQEHTSRAGLAQSVGAYPPVLFAAYDRRPVCSLRSLVPCHLVNLRRSQRDDLKNRALFVQLAVRQLKRSALAGLTSDRAMHVFG